VIVIRKSQVTAFEVAISQVFEDEMVAHARAYSPKLYHVIGEAQMRMAVQKGLADANRYGFTRRGPIQLFLELMLLFGSGVGNDPQYPWAAEHLNSGSAANQMRRSELLYLDVRRYLRQVHGPNNSLVRRALQRLADSNPADVVFPSNALEEEILRFLHWVHPEKYAYTSERAFISLIHEAIDKTVQYTGQRDGHDIGLMAALMFCFGHACDTDPLYPWIGRTLTRSRSASSNCMRVLERQALIWLKAVLRNQGN
jgi:hypothetical protein